MTNQNHAFAIIAKAIKNNEITLDEAITKLRQMSTTGIKADGSIETLAAILKELPAGRITTPGVIVDAIRKINPEAKVSAQGIARRITASPEIPLVDAVRCVSGLNYSPWRTDDKRYALKDRTIHSVEQNIDLPISEALNLAHIPYVMEERNGRLLFAENQALKMSEMIEIFKRVMEESNN